MAKKTTLKDLLEALAKERGVDVTDIDRIAGAPGVKGKLQEGAGFIEAFAETGKEKIRDVQEAVSPKGIKTFGKKAYMRTFSGDDIFSAYMRGRLAKKPVDREEKQLNTSLKVPGGEGSGTTSTTDATMKVAAENSMSLPGIARDMNVLRQNMQQLVKIWGDKNTKVASGADAHFLKSSERSKKLEVDVNKSKSFFEEQDKKEAELEAARLKKESGGATIVKEGGEEKGNLLDSIIGMFSSGFMTGIKKIFSLKNLMGVFKKVFLPVMIIGTLFSGIMDGFKKYKETGSFSEAIVSGLGGMLSFLTFGLFGEDTLKNLWDKVSGFFDPIFSTITGIFRGIKDFFKKMFGGTVDVEDKEPSADAPKPKMPDTKAASSDASKIQTPQPETTSPTPAAKTATPSKTPTKQTGGKNLEADYEKYEIAMGELQGIYSDYRNERGQMLQKLISDPRFKDGIPDDPSDPDYPEELKAIDEKYKKLISAKKSEVDKLKNVPGLKDYEKKLKEQEDEIEEEGKEIAKASQTGGSKFTSTETVSGGGSSTTKRVMSEDAKKAQEELKKLDDEQAAERKKVVDKLKSEGKIKGRFATSTDFQNIDELKNLKAKQDAERSKLIERLDSGTSFQVTSTPGASSGGGATASSGPSESIKMPSPMTAQPPSSGNSLSSASTEIAEAQRMESAADTGSVVNSPTTNNSSATAGKESKPKAASVYNDELASMLATS